VCKLHLAPTGPVRRLLPFWLGRRRPTAIAELGGLRDRDSVVSPASAQRIARALGDRSSVSPALFTSTAAGGCPVDRAFTEPSDRNRSDSTTSEGTLEALRQPPRATKQDVHPVHLPHRSLGRQRRIPRSSRTRPPEAPAPTGNPRNTRSESPASGRNPRASPLKRNPQDRPVTPEVAGSSPVAPVSNTPAKRPLARC
jgi:hypothetical protein